MQHIGWTLNFLVVSQANAMVKIASKLKIDISFIINFVVNTLLEVEHIVKSL